jgi:type II secretory pathway pseudopilin PulG
MRASSGKRRGGFILPTTLLVMTVLTVMLAAAFILVSAEYRVTDNSFASSRALALAQAGLQNYFATGHPLTGAADSTVFTFSNGYARVAAFKLRDSTATNQALWVVRSIGFDTVRASAGQPNGQRAVAQFATLNPGALPYRATMYAANGVYMVGVPTSTNPITGSDLVSCTSPRTDTNGVIVARGGYTDSAASSNTPWGDPAGVDSLASASAVIDSTHIDWAALLGGQFTPDYVATPPCLHAQQLNSSAFPSGYCDGNATLTDRRYGLLVVTGNVTLESGVHWDGIIVAGGKVDGGGDFPYKVHGMIISGLNISRGMSVPPNPIRRSDGSRTIGFGSCYTVPSISGLSGLVPIKNAWVDNWSLY